MFGGRELRHVSAGLGDDDVGGAGADAWDRADQVVECAKRLQHHLDPLGQPSDGGGVLIDQVQVQASQERVMRGEPAGQRLRQLWDLDSHPALGQLSEASWIAIAVDERLEHRPARRRR